MPTTRANAASEAAKHEEFSGKIQASDPITTKGHAPGVKVGNDLRPEYHAEVFPAGTAPEEFSHQPNAEGEVPGQQFNEFSTESTSASETLGGATSQTVHTGLGKPVQGQEEREKRGAHVRTNKKEGTGLEGVGASVGIDSVRQKGADLPEGVSKGTRGKGSDDYPGATERAPESAESVAAERS
ncbi:putative SMP domain-containing protein [Seiridium unicorne]|uniref:SMP domain-containing protein n=1 Tax=Seiridium unicorne TaxID=138068 RepID=A0ABR2V1N1_9PEZI